MSLFLIFAAAATASFGLRSLALLVRVGSSGPNWIERHIPLVTPAVLAAIVASAVAVTAGQFAAPNPFTLAALCGGALAVHRTGNVAAALATGLPIYWIGGLLGVG